VSLGAVLAILIGSTLASTHAADGEEGLKAETFYGVFHHFAGASSLLSS